MNVMLMLTFFSGVSLPAGFLGAVYFYRIRKEDTLKLNLLAALFMAMALRCSKSFLCFSLGMPTVGMALGYLGLASIGPLLWLYLKYAGKASVQSIEAKDYAHFLPSLIGFITILLMGREVAIELYFFTTYVVLAYVLWGWRTFLLDKDHHGELLRKWNLLLLISISVLCAIFLFQYHTDYLVNYMIGSALAAVAFYGLLYFALNHPVLFPVAKKKKRLDPKVVQKVKHAIEGEKVYRKPSLTLDQFSKDLDHPSYLISLAIKTEFKKSFSELINHKRIQEVLKELSKQDQDYGKIEGLAYSVGFNTPSAFYAAFKKVTGTTPTEYQKAQRRKPQLPDIVLEPKAIGEL
ncbi:helix-turn-helix transcriptional regulator [Muricauda sp. CAU 1633]|uniref:helix-turn-helix domain-containing protein n=1 Tax=Allomuricauda sp. CAU 1633 TaxID=2816036 RepID=UPI001A8EC99B|nr:AraC family transcriptional regulator [Muricauda sp. CAU 1633]MBO0323201.1 helix-turn-helix transcriptional regulator [Muricauda sp. CAU 1633]